MTFSLTLWKALKYKRRTRHCRKEPPLQHQLLKPLEDLESIRDGTAVSEKQLVNWLTPSANCTNVDINLHLFTTSTQVMGGKGGAARVSGCNVGSMELGWVIIINSSRLKAFCVYQVLFVSTDSRGLASCLSCSQEQRRSLQF